ncbi:hypothetical protein Mmc1_1014 [Magnetococcus marinus MC-1]|uniref:Peptidase S74 domain-containing protein n=1 Tax=Magnetococcus marinus (strain ATCC BAA-1437 / JCM 17883 / MC-1) TaxID=156889 RepID=A0L6D9_MAGMM|nr:tail fiber domain-containing protein [Magnetococcus marinus]ABK43532.1 hypothetical protein Mmc1_1014 [Magnetococcus marinus MC-1]
MGKSAPAMPAAPDPVATANAQAAANKEAVNESAKVNQFRQETPYGVLDWSGEIGTPDRTMKVTLSEDAQRAYGDQQAIAANLAQIAMGRMGQIDAGPFSLDGVAQVPNGASLEQARNQAMQEYYAHGSQFLDKRTANEQSKLQDRLIQQGVGLDSRAYRQAMQDFQEQSHEAYAELESRARLAGSSEASQQYQLGRQMRNDEIQEMVFQRTQPMNELSAILQGSPAIQAPSFGAPSQYSVAPADVMGAIQNNYNAQVSAANSARAANAATTGAVIGGLGAIGGAWISSRRFKQHFADLAAEDMLDAVKRLPVQAWRYNPAMVPDDDAVHVGPYAEDWQQVTGLGDGVTLNMLDVAGLLLGAVQGLIAQVEQLQAAQQEHGS